MNFRWKKILLVFLYILLRVSIKLKFCLIILINFSKCMISYNFFQTQICVLINFLKNLIHIFKVFFLYIFYLIFFTKKRILWGRFESDFFIYLYKLFFLFQFLIVLSQLFYRSFLQFYILYF